MNIVKFLRTPILKNTWEHCFCKFQSGHIFQENLSLPKRNALISGIFNLGELVYWTQVQNESRGFYLPYFPKTFSKVWAENTCCVFSKKSSEFLFFLILFSAGIYLLKDWLKRSQNGNTFFLFKWHIIVQTNRNNKLFFKDEHSYK